MADKIRNFYLNTNIYVSFVVIILAIKEIAIAKRSNNNNNSDGGAK